jgi:hypothetical protein
LIRPLQPFDFVRYALLTDQGTGNRAFTLDNLGRGVPNRVSTTTLPTLSLSLMTRPVQAVASTVGRQVKAIGAARPRSGPRTWEVSHLLVGQGDSDRVGLLPILAQQIAREGGERLFIRLQSDDPLVDDVLANGFIPSFREMLYRTRRQDRAIGSAPRKHTGANEFAVYQLYTASTPMETRLSTGVTFDQWAMARERTRGRGREYVVDGDSGLRGWLKTARRLRSSTATLMVGKDDESTAAGLIDFAMASLPRFADVLWLVSEHQSDIHRVFHRRGIDVDSEYVTLVKSMVTPVLDKERHQALPITPA